MNRHKIRIFFLVFATCVYACNTRKKLDKTIIGIWKIDSTESYKRGIIETDSVLRNYYWNFNEYNDLVFFNKDSVLQVHYVKIEDSVINCYSSKKDSSVLIFKLQLVKYQSNKMILQSIYDDNSATKFFLTKTEVKSPKEIIKKL